MGTRGHSNLLSVEDFFFFLVKTAQSLESQGWFCSDYLYELYLLGATGAQFFHLQI